MWKVARIASTCSSRASLLCVAPRDGRGCTPPPRAAHRLNTDLSRQHLRTEGSRRAHTAATAGTSQSQAAPECGPAATGQLPPDFQEAYVQLAHDLADAAGVISRKYFRTRVDVDTKKDASPVTIADRQAEEAMRHLIAERAPGHGVFGEEFGYAPGSGAGADFTWVLDPIDGTKSFITGKPLFGTLIALLYRGVPLLGIIDQPILKERWLGVTGRPTTLCGEPIRSRPCPDVSSAFLYATTPHMFSGQTEVSFNRLRDAVRIPMYGCDCYAYGLLAAGHCDLVVEADLKPYDYMALVPIIQGAGGVITDWRGGALTWAPRPATDGSALMIAEWPGEVCAAGDPALHKQALAHLAWGGQ